MREHACGRRPRITRSRATEEIASSVLTKIEPVHLTTILADTASSMSPDPNHNELPEDPENIRQIMNGGVHKEAAVAEVLNFHQQRSIKTGGTAEDVQNDFVSAKAAVGEEQQPEDDEKIQEYLQRSDTAVIYAEPVERNTDNEYPKFLKMQQQLP
ncbi:hypothetical protein QE152_g1818 [Popillia japonica]|uniref:Uncharacterized protein n=1 Tax=Popillia japonica TaxID=7064 RepID=A0AAW1N548_POPJA